MGWLNRWLEHRHRSRTKLGTDRPTSQEQPPPTPADFVSIHSILDGFTRVRLEEMKVASELRIAELKATAEERAEEKRFERELRLKRKEIKEAAAASMRELRAARGEKLGGGVLPTFIRDCEDCRAFLDNRSPAHTRDMERHATMRHKAQLDDLIRGGKIARKNASAA